MPSTRWSRALARLETHVLQMCAMASRHYFIVYMYMSSTFFFLVIRGVLDGCQFHFLTELILNVCLLSYYLIVRHGCTVMSAGHYLLRQVKYCFAVNHFNPWQAKLSKAQCSQQHTLSIPGMISECETEICSTSRLTVSAQGRCSVCVQVHTHARTGASSLCIYINKCCFY